MLCQPAMHDRTPCLNIFLQHFILKCVSFNDYPNLLTITPRRCTPPLSFNDSPYHNQRKSRSKVLLLLKDSISDLYKKAKATPRSRKNGLNTALSAQSKNHPPTQFFVSIDGRLFGGGEGSRTPVRRPTSKSFYECILKFGFA